MGGTFTDAVNEIADVAYDDNMTYFYHVLIHDSYLSSFYLHILMLDQQHPHLGV
jgi:hypothetical protein